MANLKKLSGAREQLERSREMLQTGKRMIKDGEGIVRLSKAEMARGVELLADAVKGNPVATKAVVNWLYWDCSPDVKVPWIQKAFGFSFRELLDERAVDVCDECGGPVMGKTRPPKSGHLHRDVVDRLWWTTFKGGEGTTFCSKCLERLGIKEPW